MATDPKPPYAHADKWKLRNLLHAEAKRLWALVLRSLEMAACARIPGTLAALQSLSAWVAWDRAMALAVREDLRGVGRLLRSVGDPASFGLPPGGAPWLTVAADAYCDGSGMALVFRDVHAYDAEEAAVALDAVRASVRQVAKTLDLVPHPLDAQGRPVVRVTVDRQTVWGAVAKITPKTVRVSFVHPSGETMEITARYDGGFFDIGRSLATPSDHDLESAMRRASGTKSGRAL